MKIDAAKLRLFVSRIEHTEQEIKELNEDKRDIYAEAKAALFDVPALKAVVAARRKDTDAAKARVSLFEAYLALLEGAGTEPATRAPAHGPSLSPPRGSMTTVLPASDIDTTVPDFLRRSA